MTYLYSTLDSVTFLNVDGQAWRYRDLVADGGTFDVAMMQPGYDDSAWGSGPEPFVNDHDGFFATSSWDKFGVEWGPGVPLPSPGYTAPDASRYTGTAISNGAPAASPWVEMVARYTYTVPVTVPPAYRAAIEWRVVVQYAADFLQVYIDGYPWSSGPIGGSGRTFGMVASGSTDMDPAVTPGRHVLAIHASRADSTRGHLLASAFIGPMTRLAATPLRQFPRDDALGGAPRPGRESRSVQGSARQGWSGSYR